MTERECSDQPFAGFNYDYWFICTGCGERVRITAEDMSGSPRCRPRSTRNADAALSWTSPKSADAA